MNHAPEVVFDGEVIIHLSLTHLLAHLHYSADQLLAVHLQDEQLIQSHDETKHGARAGLDELSGGEGDGSCWRESRPDLQVELSEWGRVGDVCVHLKLVWICVAHVVVVPLDLCQNL